MIASDCAFTGRRSEVESVLGFALPLVPDGAVVVDFGAGTGKPP